MKKFIHTIVICIFSTSAVMTGFLAPKAQAQLEVTRDIVFPVVGPVTYGNDFGDPRDGGTRWHKGNDILGKKMQPLVAAVDGVIKTVPYPQATWGYGVIIVDKDGYEYSYIHINNDTPGTDDGKADGMFAYAPDMQSGNPVVKGQLIGYMGDSGNAEGGPPHLHFEIEAPAGAGVLNPYPSLKAAKRLTSPVAVYPELPKEVLPYGDFGGGLTVAVGNVDGGEDEEMVTGARSGGGPLVRVYKKDKQPLTSFYAYDTKFRGGVDVALGDVNGDGIAEIITAPGTGGGPHVKIFSSTGSLLGQFFAYDQKFRGGVQVAAGDVDGDGKADIIVGPGPGGGPHVRVFTAAGKVIEEFFAYESKFRGGVDVAIMPKTAEWSSLLVTAPLSSGGSHIKYFDGTTGLLTKEFFAYESAFTGGVRVAVGSVGVSGGSPHVLTVPASGGGPHVKAFTWDGAFVKDVFAGFEQWWHGGYDIAASNGLLYIGSGPGRRSSLRPFMFKVDYAFNADSKSAFTDNSASQLTK